MFLFHLTQTSRILRPPDCLRVIIKILYRRSADRAFYRRLVKRNITANRATICFHSSPSIDNGFTGFCYSYTPGLLTATVLLSIYHIREHLYSTFQKYHTTFMFLKNDPILPPSMYLCLKPSGKQINTLFPVKIYVS